MPMIVCFFGLGSPGGEGGFGDVCRGLVWFPVHNPELLKDKLKHIKHFKSLFE